MSGRPGAVASMSLHPYCSVNNDADDMETFLNLVAKDLYQKCGSGQAGLSDVTVVFPNRRARLFFDDALSACSKQPIWSPHYTTIEEMFQSQSDLKPADRIEMVTLLHKIYCRETGSDETLDSFWPWGELMLADFDDIDRNLAPADQLFSLLSEQHELTDDTSYLTPDQLEALQQFFGEMKADKPTELRERYRKIWGVLGTIYSSFVQELESRGVGYNGLIQRRVIKKMDTDRLTARKYVFVGFNSLDKAERKLFHAIQDTKKAIFYWDYDPAYTESNLMHEAGRFLRDNLKDFKNELLPSQFENLNKAKLTIVETSTDNAQARFIPQWLKSLYPKGNAGSETAIVLADESLLQPVLHSIPQPDDPQDRNAAVNITMGYPLKETSLYNLVTALLDMQRLAIRNGKRISIQSISRVLSNPLVTALSSQAFPTLEKLRQSRRMYPDIGPLQRNENLAFIFTVTDGGQDLLQYLLKVLKALVPVIRDNQENTLFKPLMQESLYRIYTQINRLNSLMESGNLELQTDTLCRLVRSVLSSTTVPFHGEPAVGLQIMGLIETRNLDFKNVLLLSAQEGTLPRGGQNASFIPYNIRVAFGLTTMQDKSAVSSYNFYHLIQRAENVTIVYNGNTEASGLAKGQMSRYLLQLIVSDRDISRITLKSDRTDIDRQSVISVPKTRTVLEQLCNRYNIQNEKAYLSPSAINKYLDCKLRFYLAQVAGLRKPNDSDTEIDQAMFGTLFHKSAELTYDYLSTLSPDRTISKESIELLIKDRERLKGFVSEAFNQVYFQKADASPADYSGIQSINFEVIIKYLKQILNMDAKFYAPFQYVDSESDGYSHYIQVDDPLNQGSTYQVRLQGIIDRMDSKKDILRIVDYKTGKKHNYPGSVDALFNPASRNEQAFQIMYYAYILSKQPQFQDKSLAPVLIYTKSSSKPTEEDLYYRIGSNEIKDFQNQIGDEFQDRLTQVVKEIFDPQVEFSPTEDEKKCENCDFAPLCGKNRL